MRYVTDLEMRRYFEIESEIWILSDPSEIVINFKDGFQY